MADIVNTGAAANDGSGDDLRTAFQLINERFQQLLGTLSQITWAPGLAISATPLRQWTVVDGQAYVAATNHTAGATFAADLDAGRWLAVDVLQLISDLLTGAPGKGAHLVATVGGRTAQAHFDDFLNVSDKASIQAAVDAITGGDVSRGALLFTPGSDHSLSAEVLVHRKTLRVQGQNAAIKWEGPNTESMIRVTDSARVVVSDLILLGNLDTPPVAALFFDQPVIGTEGTNENHVIENVTIGRKYTADTTTGGSADATPYGRVQYGIRIGGAEDGNNDEYTIRNTQVHGATVVAISFDNAQHIWSMLEHVLVNDSAIGLRCGCNLTARNLHANRNTTADIEGIRNIEVNVDTFNAENSKLPIWSKAGASFYIWSGKVLMNQETPGHFARFESGGSLLLDCLTMVNVGAGAQTIYYRSGTGKSGKLTVRNTSVTNGDARDTWDVETGGGVNAMPVEVDIAHGPFVWKQSARSPYIDRSVAPAAVAAGASGIIASGAAKTPIGTFFNVSYSLPLQGQHLTPAYESAGQIRARLLNPTAESITLAAGRMRWMAFEEHVVSKASANVNAPSMANGTGHTATVALPGAELGDFVVYAAGASYLNSVVTCYVSAPGTVALRIHNASGGTIDPPDTLMYVGKVSEFGNFPGTAAYTPAAIANGASISVTVSVPGAQLGGHVFAAYSTDLQGLTHSAEVSAADTVTITVSNYTGAAVTLAAGYFKAMVAF